MKVKNVICGGYLPDAVNELAVGLLPLAVHPPQPDHAARDGRQAGLGQRRPALQIGFENSENRICADLEEEDEQEVGEPHRVEHAALVPSEGGLDGLGQVGPQQAVGDGRAANRICEFIRPTVGC